MGIWWGFWGKRERNNPAISVLSEEGFRRDACFSAVHEISLYPLGVAIPKNGKNLQNRKEAVDFWEVGPMHPESKQASSESTSPGEASLPNTRKLPLDHFSGFVYQIRLIL